MGRGARRHLPQTKVKAIGMQKNGQGSARRPVVVQVWQCPSQRDHPRQVPLPTSRRSHGNEDRFRSISTKANKHPFRRTRAYLPTPKSSFSRILPNWPPQSGGLRSLLRWFIEIPADMRRLEVCGAALIEYHSQKQVKCVNVGQCGVFLIET